jgi:RNA polymerase sigma-70 factor (TIGR02943 family)
MNPDAWVDAHGDILFRYALARIGDAGVAEDLVQETFLAALQAQASFRGDSAERTWLVGILRNKLIDRLRRTCRDLPLAADQEGDAVVDHLYDAFGGWRDTPKSWATDAAELSDRREFWEVFARCRDALPRRQAALFTMRTLDDADPETLCRDFGVTESNLWVLLHRARTRLRLCLEAHWFGDRKP